MIAERVGSSAAQVGHVLGLVARRPPLRRTELAFAGFNIVEWASWIAILVYAYLQGGATETGIVAFALLVPAALVAPLAGTLGDRYRAGRALFWGYVALTAGTGLTAAALLTDAEPLVVYAAAAVASATITVTRPTMAAFVPSLARVPDELTAINVVSGWTESVSVLLAPALAGALLAISDTATVFAVMAVIAACSALLVRPFPGPRPAARDDEESVARSLATAAGVLRRERFGRMLVLVLAADFVAMGALDVLYPELAIGVLERDESWAGYLNAAFGAGAAVAVVVTAGLVGRSRLVPSLLLGLGLYSVALVVLAFTPQTAAVMLLLAVAGSGRVIFDVATRTLLQRVAPTDVLARIFGLLESLLMVGLALGSLAVALLVTIGGAPLALVGIALLLPVAALIAGRSLVDVDRQATVPVVEINLLRSLPLFALLPAGQIELLARSLARLDVAAGTDVIVQGESGHTFYVVADGEIEVVRDGVAVATLGRGDGFGEIALLHDVPRTATCRATTSAILFALEQEDFLTGVTGHAQADAEARRLAGARSPEAGATTTVR